MLKKLNVFIFFVLILSTSLANCAARSTKSSAVIDQEMRSFIQSSCQLDDEGKALKAKLIKIKKMKELCDILPVADMPLEFYITNLNYPIPYCNNMTLLQIVVTFVNAKEEGEAVDVVKKLLAKGSDPLPWIESDPNELYSGKNSIEIAQMRGLKSISEVLEKDVEGKIGDTKCIPPEKVKKKKNEPVRMSSDSSNSSSSSSTSSSSSSPSSSSSIPVSRAAAKKKKKKERLVRQIKNLQSLVSKAVSSIKLTEKEETIRNELMKIQSMKEACEAISKIGIPIEHYLQHINDYIKHDNFRGFTLLNLVLSVVQWDEQIPALNLVKMLLAIGADPLLTTKFDTILAEGSLMADKPLNALELAQIRKFDDIKKVIEEHIKAKAEASCELKSEIAAKKSGKKQKRGKTEVSSSSGSPSTSRSRSSVASKASVETKEEKKEAKEDKEAERKIVLDAEERALLEEILKLRDVKRYFEGPNKLEQDEIKQAVDEIHGPSKTGAAILLNSEDLAFFIRNFNEPLIVEWPFTTLMWTIIDWGNQDEEPIVVSVVKKLIEKGANINIRVEDNKNLEGYGYEKLKGMTLYQLALMKNFKSVASVLASYISLEHA